MYVKQVKNFMKTNLANMVDKSALTRKEIAHLKGVTPETLARHINGKINLNIEDAIDYGKILDCKAQEIMFVNQPIDIIGHNYITKDGDIERDYFGAATTKQAFIPDYYIENTAAFTWECDPDYEGPWYEWQRAIQIVLKEPIIHEFVDNRCIQNLSTVKLKEPVSCKKCNTTHQIVAGIVYPAPGNKYTIHSPKTDILLENKKLIWATPQIQLIIRPDLRGCKIVDSANNQIVTFLPKSA